MPKYFGYNTLAGKTLGDDDCNKSRRAENHFSVYLIIEDEGNNVTTMQEWIKANGGIVPEDGHIGEFQQDGKAYEEMSVSIPYGKLLELAELDEVARLEGSPCMVPASLKINPPNQAAVGRVEV